MSDDDNGYDLDDYDGQVAEASNSSSGMSGSEVPPGCSEYNHYKENSSYDYKDDKVETHSECEKEYIHYRK